MKTLIKSFLFRSKKESRFVEKDNECPIYLTAKLLKHMSMTCSCGALAIPVEQKGSSYQCIKCHKQHQNIGYNLGFIKDYSMANTSPKNSSNILDMAYYDDAINLLKYDYKRNKTVFRNNKNESMFN